MSSLVRRVRITPADRASDAVEAVRRRAASLGRHGQEVEAIAASALVARAALAVATPSTAGRRALEYGGELGAQHAVLGRSFSDADRDAVRGLAEAALDDALDRAVFDDERCSAALRRGWMALSTGDWETASEVIRVRVPRESDGVHPGRIMSCDVNLQQIHVAALMHDRTTGRRALVNSSIHRQRQWQEQIARRQVG